MIIEFKRTLEIPDEKLKERGFVDIALQQFLRTIIKDAMHGDIKKEFQEHVKTENVKRRAKPAPKKPEVTA